jgi:hypothetical protein
MEALARIRRNTVTSILPPTVAAVIALLAFMALPAEAEEGSAQKISALAEHMHGHLDEISAIKAAVIAGKLIDVRSPAMWLATHDQPDGLPEGWAPFVEQMRRYATSAMEAEDLTTVAVAVSEIARACGECHVNSGVTVAFGFDQPPPRAEQGLTTQMRRHLWAADRMWEGLIGPSDAAWNRGTDMLTEVQLQSSDITAASDDRDQVDELLASVRAVGQQGRLAITPKERSALYGQFLSSCSNCHRLTGGGPKTD